MNNQEKMKIKLFYNNLEINSNYSISCRKIPNIKPKTKMNINNLL